MYRSEHNVTKKASHAAEDRQVPFTYHEFAAAQKPTKNDSLTAFWSLFMFLVHPDFFLIYQSLKSASY